MEDTKPNSLRTRKLCSGVVLTAWTKLAAISFNQVPVSNYIWFHFYNNGKLSWNVLREHLPKSLRRRQIACHFLVGLFNFYSMRLVIVTCRVSYRLYSRPKNCTVFDSANKLTDFFISLLFPSSFA